MRSQQVIEAEGRLCLVRSPAISDTTLKATAQRDLSSRQHVYEPISTRPNRENTIVTSAHDSSQCWGFQEATEKPTSLGLGDRRTVVE